ncbi:MAG: DUF45 domain-containing protein [Gammaproteobacteria bacterium]|nr:MAG: DUF45 domain-containing protein [Gammaproteobacteria bacterium]
MLVSGENLIVSGINIQVVRKNIKNINFSVRAANGQVRISAPKYITDEALEAAVLSRMGWIHKRIQTIKSLPILQVKKYVTSETHDFMGKQYTLEVVEQSGKPQMQLQSSGTLKMCIRPNTKLVNRERVLNEWYRAELKMRIPVLIEKWQPIIGKKVSEWSVKKMKTRWGTCNINKKRIWLNLELAKQPEACLEYVVVHEMTHLIERNHNKHFRRLLDSFIPSWENIERDLKMIELA